MIRILWQPTRGLIDAATVTTARKLLGRAQAAKTAMSPPSLIPVITTRSGLARFWVLMAGGSTLAAACEAIGVHRQTGRNWRQATGDRIPLRSGSYLVDRPIVPTATGCCCQGLSGHGAVTPGVAGVWSLVG